MSLIIIEGPDGAGKSVLTNTLSLRLSGQGYSIKTHHHGPYPHLNDPSLHYLASLRRRSHVDQHHVTILDRCWLSEVPYGAVLRGGTDRVGLASRRMLERVALRCGAVVVRCLPPFEVCQRNWAVRRHLELVKDDEKLKAIYERYQAMEAHTHLTVLTYDYAGARDGLDPVIAAIERLKDHRSPAVGIGAFAPSSTLLVGDRVSQYGFDDLPFVSFTRGGCSRWLAQKLEGWGVAESALYWVNALGLDPEFLGRDDAPQRVVALGANAARWCERAGLDFTTVAHPQAHKRFHFNEEYVDLKEALA